MARRVRNNAFAESHAGALGSLSATFGAGVSVQFLSALAGMAALPVLVHGLGTSKFGVLVVIVSLAPWVTLVDGALQPATRLLVGERRDIGRMGASAALLRSGVRLGVRIASGNLLTLSFAVFVLPLVSLFGAGGVVGRRELAVSIVAFSVPIILTGPGGLFLGALEGVGRTVVAVILTGVGPLFALPLTIIAVAEGAGLAVCCFIQGLSVALSRALAALYWRLRPSTSTTSGEDDRMPPPLVGRMAVLSAAILIQSGLDPVIVASALGADQAGSYGVAARIVNGALIPLAVVTPLFVGNLAMARSRGWGAEEDRNLRRLVLLAGCMGSVAGGLVVFAGPPLAHVIGAGRVEAPGSLYLASGAFIFATFVSAPLFRAFSGPTGLRWSVRLNVVLVFLNVGASLVLVRELGPAGPMWASTGAAASTSAFWLIAWRQRPRLLGEVHPTVYAQDAAAESGD